MLLFISTKLSFRRNIYLIRFLFPLPIIYATELLKLYAYMLPTAMEQHNNAEPPKVGTEQRWKNIWEKEKTHNICAKWLRELKTTHSNISVQEPESHHQVTHIQQWVKNVKSWSAPDFDLDHSLTKETNSNALTLSSTDESAVSNRHSPR